MLSHKILYHIYQLNWNFLFYEYSINIFNDIVLLRRQLYCKLNFVWCKYRDFILGTFSYTMTVNIVMKAVYHRTLCMTMTMFFKVAYSLSYERTSVRILSILTFLHSILLYLFIYFFSCFIFHPIFFVINKCLEKKKKKEGTVKGFTWIISQK